jgi:hypothetical protein
MSFSVKIPAFEDLKIDLTNLRRQMSHVYNSTSSRQDMQQSFDLLSQLLGFNEGSENSENIQITEYTLSL